MTRAQRKTAPQSWKPLYLAYAAACGKTPEAMLDADTEQWPGDPQRGFKQWKALYQTYAATCGTTIEAVLEAADGEQWSRDVQRGFKQWKTRYLAYAAASGKTPEAMLADDGEAWPGDALRGFDQWIRWAWKTWDEIPRSHPQSGAHERGPDHRRTELEQHAFTSWLAQALGVAL